MADYNLNRARLNAAPMELPYAIHNEQSITLASGVSVSAPRVALAYSNAVLALTGDSTHEGSSITVECNGNSVTVTLDSEGSAQVSLLPFIRNMVVGALVLDNPLYCEEGAVWSQNNFRGFVDVLIREAGQTPLTMRVWYIFGNYAPKGEMVTDLYFDYDANGETWCNVDAASHYSAQGIPADFEDNWCNINEIVESEPSGDFSMPIGVAWYYGGDDIQFSIVNYHFRYDCRSENVLKVRWLDTNGNINTRKFTISGRSHGASVGDTWQRPHATKEIIMGYDRGKDEWANMSANETINIGDDCIPMTHYDWLKTIASSAIVEAYIGGVWTRCNLGGASVECDPRKSQLSVSLTLVVPTDDVQQF